MEVYLNAAISGNTENLPQPISRIDYLLYALVEAISESGASSEDIEKIVSEKIAEVVADSPEDFDTLKEISDWIYTHENSAAAMNTAIQENTNSITSLTTEMNNKANSDDVYDKTTADSTFLGVNATAVKSTADENGENIANNFAAVKNDIAVNKSTLGTQCKNLFNPNTVNWYQPTKTSIAEDGTITSTTTSDSRTWDLANSEYFLTLPAGKYIVKTITESLDDTISANENIRGYNETGSQVFGIYPNIVGTRTTTFTIDTVTTIGIMFKLFTQTCKIMIYDADILDDIYEPYSDNVDTRITQNKSDIAVNKTTLGYQRKNLLKPTSSITRAGITYTVNDDGSVTLTGASTTGSTYNYFSIPITLKPGKYKVNGMPETSKTTTYRADLRATESGGTTYGYGVKEFEVEFTEITTAYYMIRIDGSYKESLDGITFYPMIRYADIIDDTYEPYQPSLQEQISALISRIEALENSSTT